MKKTTKVTLPLDMVELQTGSYHVFLFAKVNGRKVRLLLDTGASKTVLDQTFVQEKCKTQALETIEQATSSLHATVSESNITFIKEIAFDTLKIKKYLVAVIDLTHVNETYSQVGKKPIHGILGSDILLENKAIIDYHKKQICFKF